MTKEEFIQDFKERVVNDTYSYLPKDYRKSREYSDRAFETIFNEALDCSTRENVLLNIIESYYDKIHEYEEMLGY